MTNEIPGPGYGPLEGAVDSHEPHATGYAGRPTFPEPGSVRDRCSRCGGWISMGHARGSACRAHLDD